VINYPTSKQKSWKWPPKYATLGLEAMRVSIESHNIYENVRTRTIVLHDHAVLVHPPLEHDYWRLPGGGLEPGESLAECARREVLEETGIAVKVGPIAFLLEWVIPGGFGLEVYHYACPEEPVPQARPERPHHQPARWVPLTEVERLPIYPKQFKLLCSRLAEGRAPAGIITVRGEIESPWAVSDSDPWK
jgi:phosphatase NudJ